MRAKMSNRDLIAYFIHALGWRARTDDRMRVNSGRCERQIARIRSAAFAACIVVLATPAARAQLTEAPAQTFGTPAVTAGGSRSTAICGPGDQPETAMQGETPLKDIQSGRNKSPYYCGMRIVGHLDP